MLCLEVNFPWSSMAFQIIRILFLHGNENGDLLFPHSNSFNHFNHFNVLTWVFMYLTSSIVKEYIQCTHHVDASCGICSKYKSMAKTEVSKDQDFLYYQLQRHLCNSWRGYYCMAINHLLFLITFIYFFEINIIKLTGYCFPYPLI